MAKEVPLEKDYTHWKELYEMGERRHSAEVEKWQQSVACWQNHSLTLSAAIRALLTNK